MRSLKRFLDLLGATSALLALAPLFALTAALVKLGSRGPVFYRQLRTGRHGETFRMWKFRTMFPDADARKNELAHLNHHAHNGDARLFKIRNDPRVTRVGRFLRRHYLDEFPQLLNVLTGDMSLVGPRPLILEEAAHVPGWAVCRHDVRPGMTGLWQVRGGSALGFGEMMELDYRYVTNWSLADDIGLLARTVPVVVRGVRAE
jgi:lipopolysaccharide/colanic/teichoic acid biosynthesis glycosyltransferase